MEIQLYNVYEDGKLTMKDVKPERIWKVTRKRVKISYYADRDVLLYGKYRIERSRIEQDYNEIRVKRRMLEDWEQLVAPFSRVIWVTALTRDVRVLTVKGKEAL